jgi:flavin reductase (DIM6/NTAB) family NADH-FMN oxidoreductase RutF
MSPDGLFRFPWHNRMVIHNENPFAQGGDDLLRRFRGRLPSPVTIITAGDEISQTGLTVSSLFAIEGDPALVYAAVGPNSDLFDMVQSTGKFVVHICRQGQEGLAEVFAGLRPSPGGMFSGSEWELSDWGPVLSVVPDRAFCSLQSIEERGWSGILIGEVDNIAHTDIVDPLVHFRGTYRNLGAR